MPDPEQSYLIKPPNCFDFSGKCDTEALMASSLQDGNLAESLRESHWVVAGVVFLLISLTAAISLVGSIPGALIVEANDKTRPATIYRHKLWKTVPFWLLASLEHIFFLAAVLCFAVAALE